MILIPQRLFSDPKARVILRDGHKCILHKQLDAPLLGREAYVTQHVVSVLLAGEQRLKTYDDKVIRVRAGEVVFLPRGVYYVTDLLPEAGQFRSLLFYFDDDIIHSFLQHSRVTEVDRSMAPDHLKFAQDENIRSFTEALLRIYGGAASGKAFVDLKILELLHLLNARLPDKQFAEFLFRLTLPGKRNIRDFMERNYDKPLKMEDYAYLTGRSLSTFRRDFKSHFSLTPQRWIKDRRLAKAIQLLEGGEMPVTELAYEVGYQNISYFIREFKGKTGQSPKQYMLSRRLGDKS